MKSEHFPLAAYLERIGLQHAPKADLDGLAQLMRAQLFAVPFENLDVQAGLEISLEPQAILQKILGRARGGYCYEVNGLFAMALGALGFRCRILGARPMFYPTRRAKTHMVVAVQLGATSYLCDTGFGSYGLRAPLAIEVTDEGVWQDWDRFRLQPLDAGELALQAWVDGDWRSQFSFDDYPMEMLDFGPANYFNSHSPEAIFVQKIVIVQHTPAARRMLVGCEYREISAAGCKVVEYQPSELAAAVASHFGLSVQALT